MAVSHYSRGEFVAARARPPARLTGFQRLRRSYFGDGSSALATLVVVAGAAWLAWWAFRWGILEAVFPNHDNLKSAVLACRAAEGHGACWPVIAEKGRLILFGLYPYDQQWRPATACLLMIALYAVTMWRRSWRPALALVWIAIGAVVSVLMWGGVLGLPYVDDDRWGGLPVTLLLATVGLALAFPIAIVLALARQAEKAVALRSLAIGWIELARSIPLVTVLFMSSVMVPLFLPPGMEISKLLRVQVAIALFAAAYLAEVIRGGLLAVPKGQYLAADSVGMTYAQKMGSVILPQALRHAVPGIVNTFISFFKATSVVIIVGIFDLMSAAKRSVVDPDWQGFGTEVYLFVGFIYFVFCFSISRFSRRLESQDPQR